LSPAGWIDTRPYRSVIRMPAGGAATCIQRIRLALLSRIICPSSWVIHSGTAPPIAAHSFVARIAYPVRKTCLSLM
jgi:hypothetical protein